MGDVRGVGFWENREGGVRQMGEERVGEGGSKRVRRREVGGLEHPTPSPSPTWHKFDTPWP